MSVKRVFSGNAEIEEPVGALVGGLGQDLLAVRVRYDFPHAARAFAGLGSRPALGQLAHFCRVQRQDGGSRMGVEG